MRFRDTFTTPYRQLADREGQPFTVIRLLGSDGEPVEGWDDEVLPAVEIRFPDGVQVTAWPEEVCYEEEGA